MEQLGSFSDSLSTKMLTGNMDSKLIEQKLWK